MVCIRSLRAYDPLVVKRIRCSQAAQLSDHRQGDSAAVADRHPSG